MTNRFGDKLRDARGLFASVHLREFRYIEMMTDLGVDILVQAKA